MKQNKIYVGNLSFQTSQEGLTDAFADFGDIEDLKIITDRETGRSRGFAFITFSDDDAAQEALSLNDTDLDGRQIKVNIARDKRDRDNRDARRW